MVLGDNNKYYTTTGHMKYFDWENVGVLNLGIHPGKLRQENILFYIFHIRSSITIQLMDYWQKFLMLQTEIIMEE